MNKFNHLRIDISLFDSFFGPDYDTVAETDGSYIKVFELRMAIEDMLSNGVSKREIVDLLLDGLE